MGLGCRGRRALSAAEDSPGWAGVVFAGQERGLKPVALVKAERALRPEHGTPVHPATRHADVVTLQEHATSVSPKSDNTPGAGRAHTV